MCDRKSEIAVKSLHFHQEQQLKMMELMEGIRWKFITAFGLGAGFAVFFAVTRKVSEEELSGAFVLSLCIVVIVSLAALVTQIRIYSIVHSTWDKLHDLQRIETKLMNDEMSLDRELMFTNVLPKRRSWAHLLTVHMSSCFVFCGFISISVVMLLSSQSLALNIGVFMALLLFMMLIIWRVTCWYVGQVKLG